MAYRPPRAPKAPALPFGKQGDFKPPSNYKGGRHARQKPGVMNKTEEKRARELDEALQRGEIAGWMFQPMRLRLAEDNAWYTIDFMVTRNDGLIELEEIKGHWEAAALLRIKVAADRYGFIFVALRAKPKKDGGGWDRRVFKGWTDPSDRPDINAAPAALLADDDDDLFGRIEGGKQ